MSVQRTRSEEFNKCSKLDGLKVGIAEIIFEFEAQEVTLLDAPPTTILLGLHLHFHSSIIRRTTLLSPLYVTHMAAQ
jgi:hypothetical protein